MDLADRQALQGAVAAHNVGSLEEAARLYRVVLQTHPKHPDANHNLGLIAVALNNLDSALPHFKIALEENPNIEQFWLSYIGALTKRKEFKNAKRVIKKAKKAGFAGKKFKAAEVEVKRSNPGFDENLLDGLKVPSEADINNMLRSYEDERYEDAERLARSITKRFPTHQAGWKILGVVLGQTDRMLEALVAQKKAVALAQEDAESQTNLGLMLQKLNRLEEAEASYRQAIICKPDYIDAHYNLAITLQGLGKLEESEVSYTRTIKLKPDFAEAHNNLGSAQYELGRLEEGEVSYRKAIELKPDYALARYNLGNTLSELGRLEEAQRNYREAVALKPDYVEAHYNLGNCLKQLGLLKGSEVSYRRAILLRPDFPEALSNLGNTLQELGRLVEAEISHRKALELTPEFSEGYNNLGSTLKELGRLEEAEASYRQAMALKQGYAEATYNLGILYYEGGRYEKAENQFTLIDLRMSKVYLLRCLYMQDQQSSFYDQLDDILNQGENNALIGSIISQSNIRYGSNKHNPFCNEPLKYVVETDLLKRCDFKTVFFNSVNEILSDRQVQVRNQRLLSKGIQTAGNVFSQAGQTIGEIERIIRSELEKYRVLFNSSEEGLITNWPTDYRLYGWLVSMKSGGELDAHIHERGWVSGSIYVNVPPRSNSDSGNLVVGLGDVKNRLSGLEKRVSIHVETGSLCLFPASLHHYTIPFEAEEDRIVLAFDVIRNN